MKNVSRPCQIMIHQRSDRITRKFRTYLSRVDFDTRLRMAVPPVKSAALIGRNNPPKFCPVTLSKCLNQMTHAPIEQEVKI